MFETKKKILPLNKLLELYKNGERDFSNIMCSGVDFTNIKIPGCNFTNSDLSYGQFAGADISNCNFTNANLEWSGFKRADMRNSNFTKTNISYSVLNDAKVEGAIFDKTNASWCFMFNITLTEAQKKTADLMMTAFNPSEVTEEGRLAVAEKIKSKKDMPFDISLRLEFIFKTDQEEIDKSKLNVQETSSYGKANVSYSNKTGGAYSVNQPHQQDVAYNQDTNYIEKRKKKDDIYKS